MEDSAEVIGLGWICERISFGRESENVPEGTHTGDRQQGERKREVGKIGA